MSNVYVIFNEWTDIANNTSSQLVDSAYFETEEDAWGALRDIAFAYLVDLDPGETSVQLEDHTPSLQYEEYYIQELNKK